MMNTSQSTSDHDEKKRIFVLGSSGYSDIDSTEWDTEQLPNIVDYDIVIVDVPSLNEEKLKAIQYKHLKEIRYQLARLLHSKGQIIVITSHSLVDRRPDSYPTIINNYDWSPVNIGIANEAGESIAKKNERFESYLKHMTSWTYYLYIPTDCLSSELTNFYGATYSIEYSTPLSPILANRYDRVLASSFFIEIRYEREEPRRRFSTSSKKYYPEDPDSVTGEIVLLPFLPQFENKEVVSIILQDLIGYSPAPSAPDWAEEYTIPGVNVLNQQIEENREKIKVIFTEVRDLEKAKTDLVAYRKLIYSCGFDLEDIFKKCLEDLGGKVTPSKYSEEEYILEYEGQEYLIEVKGVSKSISLAHLRQLSDYLLKYEENTGKDCKGILFGNAWRNLNPNDRNTTEHPIFPENVIKRGTQLEVSLLSSTEFFNAFCEFLEKKKTGEQILKKIISEGGVIDFT